MNFYKYHRRQMRLWTRDSAQGCGVLGSVREEAEELIGFGWMEGGREASWSSENESIVSKRQVKVLFFFLLIVAKRDRFRECKFGPRGS